MAYVRRNVYSYDGCNVCTYFAYITHIRIIIPINILIICLYMAIVEIS